MKINVDDFVIKFLRSGMTEACSFSFIYPEKDDVATVPQTDVFKLSHPMITGGTKRVASKLKFQFDFSKYQSLY